MPKCTLCNTWIKSSKAYNLPCCEKAISCGRCIVKNNIIICTICNKDVEITKKDISTSSKVCISITSSFRDIELTTKKFYNDIKGITKKNIYEALYDIMMCMIYISPLIAILYTALYQWQLMYNILEHSDKEYARTAEICMYNQTTKGFRKKTIEDIEWIYINTSLMNNNDYICYLNTCSFNSFCNVFKIFNTCGTYMSVSILSYIITCIVVIDNYQIMDDMLMIITINITTLIAFIHIVILNWLLTIDILTGTSLFVSLIIVNLIIYFAGKIIGVYNKNFYQNPGDVEMYVNHV